MNLRVLFPAYPLYIFLLLNLFVLSSAFAQEQDARRTCQHFP